MKVSNFSLVAVAILLVSAPAPGQTLRSVEAIEVVDATGVRVGDLQGGGLMLEFDDQLFGVPMNQME